MFINVDAIFEPHYFSLNDLSSSHFKDLYDTKNKLCICDLHSPLIAPPYPYAVLSQPHLSKVVFSKQTHTIIIVFDKGSIAVTSQESYRDQLISVADS